MIQIGTKDETTLKAMGARLVVVRGEQRLTQDAFAKSVGLSARAYHYYERGQRSMPIEAIVAAAELYNVDLNWLVRGLDKGDLSDVGDDIEEFARDLYDYLSKNDAKLRSESFGAIVSRWYQAARGGKKISAEDVQIWVDLMRVN